MKVLIIKTSSIGDIIHTFPALTDAQHQLNDLSFDWVVEESFIELPTMHPSVDKVIPVANRRWRKNIWQTLRSGEYRRFVDLLQRQSYDYIIDAQGLLLKSAWVAGKARGISIGYDRLSAREPLSAWFYDRKIAVSRQQHAITRIRQLFSQALTYQYDDNHLDYGLTVNHHASPSRQLMFLHGTTWESKHWPNEYWLSLINLANSENYHVKMPWVSDAEKQRLNWLQAQGVKFEMLDKMSISALSRVMVSCDGIVGMDSGLTHLSAALDIPTVALYGPTKEGLTGAIGKRLINLSAKFSCAPCMKHRCDFEGESSVAPACFEQLDASTVWKALKQQMMKNSVLEP